MSTKWIFLPVILLILLLAGCSATPGTITGRVLFPAISDAGYSGLGVAVVVLDGTDYTYTTPDGSFEFQNVRAGKHTLTVKEGYFTTPPVEVVLTGQGINVEVPVEIDYLYFSCSEDDRTEGQYNLKVFFTRSGIQAEKVVVSIPASNVFGEFASISTEQTCFDGLLELNGVGLDQSYTLQFTYFTAEEQVVENYEKSIFVPTLTQLPVTGIESGHPTFHWTAVDSPLLVSYEIIIEKNNQYDHAIHPQGTSYTLQSELTSGSYSAEVRATLVHPITGTLLARLSSNTVSFNIP